jgi:hypothetical protein
VGNKGNSQLKNATTNPNALPAVCRAMLLSIYPHASSNNTMSRTKRSKNKIQLDRMAAMVKITVKINQAQRYIARALGNWAFSSPVALSV